MSRIVDTSSKLKTSLQIILGGHVFAASLATYWGNETWYKSFLMPTLRLIFDAETTHKWAITAAKYNFIPRIKVINYCELETKLWGYDFKSPIGLAAGFDKDGIAIDGLSRIGFSFIEIGSVTPIAQEGNPKPRVFRLAKDMAVINRYGFNSVGHDLVYKNIKLQKKKLSKDSSILGVNLGKNKESIDAFDDFIKGIQKFSEIANYLVINLSSPNTPGLRNLQMKSELEKLLNKVDEFKKSSPIKLPPILIKISPDLSLEEKKDIASIVNTSKYAVSGLIISNTSLTRPNSLISENKKEAGGLSGIPIRDMSTETIRDIYTLTNGKIPIIGVGGVFTGKDAYEKIRNGASLVQIYTSLIYEGPPIVAKINKELHEALTNDGYKHISEIIGIDARIS